MFLSDVMKYFQTLTPNFHSEIRYLTNNSDFRAQTQGQRHESVRTPTLTATSSFSNVPLKQIWSKLSIIFVGTTYKGAEQRREMSGRYDDGSVVWVPVWHTEVCLTPAISMMVLSVISLSTLSRAALWRKVMAFRRSPSDTLTNAAML